MRVDQGMDMSILTMFSHIIVELWKKLYDFCIKLRLGFLTVCFNVFVPWLYSN